MGEPNGTMKTLDEQYPAGIRMIAVSLLIVFLSVTTFADLFHTHKDLEKRLDCPACLWHQMSQDADAGPSATELIASSLILTTETPLLHDGRVRVACDISTGTPIRAPPSL